MSIGVHVGKDGKRNLIDSLISYFYDTKTSKVAQIFMYGPQSAHKCNIDKKQLNVLCTTNNIYVHSAYVTSLMKQAFLIEQIETCNTVNIKGLVIHLCKKSPQILGKQIADASMHTNGKYPLLIEMTAVLPDKNSYESPEKIIALIDALIENKVTSDRVRICIDTAHIYASRAKIESKADADAYLHKLRYHAEWIGLIHLNGNQNDNKDKAKDKHAVPLSSIDKIWGGMEYNESGCKSFIDYATNNNIDTILEQHYSYNKNFLHELLLFT